jgi:hypothetical protein
VGFCCRLHPATGGIGVKHGCGRHVVGVAGVFFLAVRTLGNVTVSAELIYENVCIFFY